MQARHLIVCLMLVAAAVALVGIYVVHGVNGPGVGAESAPTGGRDSTPDVGSAPTAPTPSEPALVTEDTPTVPAEVNRTPDAGAVSTGLSPVQTPPASTSTGPEPELDRTAFRAAVDQIVADVDGTVAIVLADQDGTVLYELNAAESMESASLYKLAIMVELYHQRETGVLSFDESVLLQWSYFAEGEDSIGSEAVDGAMTVDSLLYAMIAQSSNVAAYALLDLVGSDSVNATMADFGFGGTQVRWSPWHPAPEDHIPDEPAVDEDATDDGIEDEPGNDEEDSPAGSAPARWMSHSVVSIAPTLRAEAALNVTSAEDLARLFVLMLNGELVNETASAEMLELLGQQEIPGGLTFGLPEGVVAHKTGYLEDGVVNDAGVIFGLDGPRIAIVLTEDVREDIAYTLMLEIGLLLYHFESE